jgi:uncharacterized membrane protein
MERNKASLQGKLIIVFGVVFIILISSLYMLSYVKGDRVFIFYGLSVLLVVMGVVMLLLARRVPQQNMKKPRQKT